MHYLKKFIMSKQNIAKRIALAFFISAVLSATIIITFAVLFNSHDLTVGLMSAYIIFFTCIAIPVIMIIANIIIYIARRSAVKKSLLSTQLNKWLKDREQIGDPKKISNRVKVLNAICIVAILLYVLSCILGIIGSMLMINTVGNWWFIVMAIFFTVLLIFIVYKSFPTPKQSTINAPTILPKETFLLLHKITSTAASFVGITKPYELHLHYDASVSIRDTGKYYLILLGEDALKMLEKKELTAVMVHEFAHAKAGDLLLVKRIKRVVELVVGKNPMGIFLGQLFNILVSTTVDFELARSKLREEMADKAVIGKGLEQYLVNALAKLTMFEYASDAYPITNRYIKEEPPVDIAKSLFDDFLEKYEHYKEVWHKMCRQELPHRYSSHPTCSERMKYLNIADFKIDFFNQCDSYKEEEEKAAKISRSLHDKISKKDWKELRKEAYLDYLEAVEGYEKNGEGDLYDIYAAYYNLCRYDDALAITDSLLKLNPKDATALFYKGDLLCAKFDDSGLGLLKQSVDYDLKFVEGATETISKYLVRHALVDRRIIFRKWCDSKLEEWYQLCKYKTLNEIEDYVPHDLDRKTVEEVKKILLEEGVLSCHIFKRSRENQSRYYVLLEQPTRAETVAYNKQRGRIIKKLSTFGITFFLMQFGTGHVVDKRARTLNDSKVYIEPNSLFNVPLDKNGRAKRIKRKASPGKWLWAIFGSSIAVTLGAIIALFVLGISGLEGLLYVLMIPLSILSTNVMIGVIIVISILRSKDRRLYFNGNFKRDTFKFTTTHAKEYLEDLRVRTKLADVYTITKDTGSNDIKEELTFVYTFPMVSANDAPEYSYVIIKRIDNTFTIESFIFVEDTRAFEMGLNGFETNNRKTARALTRIFLDSLNAPVTMNA